LYGSGGGANDVIRWYNVSSGGSPISTYQPNISSTTTFYAALYNTQSGCEGARAAATVTVYPLPGTPTITSPSGNVSQCNGAAIITLSCDTPAHASYFQWYKDGNAISGATSSGYTIFLGDQLPYAGSYTVVAKGTGGWCSSSQSAARIITINALPQNVAVSPGSVAVCSGATTNITVTGSEAGVNYQLFISASPVSGVVAGGGTINITSYSLTSGGTVTVRATNASTGCTILLSNSTTLTVNPLPGVAGGSVSPSTLCGSGTVAWSASGLGTNEEYRWYTVSTGGSAITPATNITSTTTYYVARYNYVTACEGPRTAVTVTFNPSITTAPTVTGHSRFGTGPLTLVGNGNPLGTNYRWYTFTNTLLSSGPNYPITSVSASALNYMKVSSISPAGCEGPKTTIDINVYTDPVVTAPQNFVVKEAPVTLTATSGNETYIWRNSANAIVQTGSSPTFNATLPDTYTVTALRTTATSSAIPYTLNGPLVGVNMNYVVSNNVLALNITDPAQVPNLAAEKVTQTIAYFDGLGRPLQNVATQASPQKSDLVTPIKYDQYGRQAKAYLPYIQLTGGVPENNGRFKSNDLTGQATFYNPATTYLDKVRTDVSPWAETVFEASPLNRVSQKGASGAVWQPNLATPDNGKAVKMQYLVNADGNTTAGQEQIKMWTLTPVTLASGPEFILSSSSNYPSNRLYVTVTKDEENRQVREYTDKLGKVILKKVQEAAGVNPLTYDNNNWTLTYYIYDDFERLRFVLQPKFIYRNSTYDTLGTNQLKKDMLDSLTFEYRYDDRGRMIYKRVPGAKQVDMVYDQWDRLVLSRDGNQKASGKWSFIKYDVLNRPIITGEIASANTRDQMVTAVAGVTTRYETTTSGNGVGYTLNQTYPTAATINDIYTITYYDDYSFKTNLALGTAYDASIPGGFTGVVSTRIKNLVTGSKIRVLQSSPLQWLVTASYYDDRYRMIQSIGDDHLNNKNKITNEYYGLTPWITKSQLNHGTALTSLTETFYDHMGRVKEVWQTMDNLPATRTLLASHKYNELGELVEKNIHSTNSGTTFLQYNDYRYNIRGWLTHINNSTLTTDAQVNDNDPTSDLFGMELKYNEIVSINGVNTKEQYNGNISAIQWKTNNLVDAATEKIYGFKYDQLNRLLDATYATKNATTWTGNVNLFNENLTYDKNGNIRTLKRRSLFNNTDNVMVDDMRYFYKGNQLDAVGDYASPTYKPYGFAETTTLTTGEYTYDANGSMEVDQNKGLVGPTGPDPKGVLYNHLNLPREVRFGNKKIVYTYDAAGTKLRKVTYDNSGTLISRTEYVGGIQYESVQPLASPPLAADLKFMMTSEGRAVKNAGVWQYEYFHKDHLGNTRVVYGYQKQVDEYKATMESPLATKEQAQFYNISTRRVTAFNRTPSSIEVVIPDKSAETNGNLSKAIGPAKMLQVTAGDRVQLEVFARYATGTGSNSTLISNLASAVTGSFMLTAGETAHTALTNSVPTQAATIGQTTGVPKAYLFYILFNSSYVYQQFGYVAVTSTALVGHQQMYLDITIPTGGYLYTYVANESNVSSATSVYFDDFNIIHTRNTNSLQVVQTTDYYPFGLAIAAQSYQKQSSLDNDYLYNGKEFQDEYNLGMIDYGWRMYDPAIGRWGAVDGMAEKYYSLSQYNFVANNPIKNFDVDGNQFTDDAWTWVNRLMNDINSRQEKNNDKISDKREALSAGGLSERQTNRLNKQIGKLEANNQALESTRGEIATLAASDQFYNVDENSSMNQQGPVGGTGSERGETSFNFNTGAVDITISSSAGLGLFAHELKHAHQFEIGDLSLGERGQTGFVFLRDQQDELDGFRRQQLFGGGMPVGVDLTRGALPDNSDYAGLPKGPINIHNFNPAVSTAIQLNNTSLFQQLANQRRQAFRLNGTTYKPTK
jgi:RHS repeat-associated protein